MGNAALKRERFRLDKENLLRYIKALTSAAAITFIASSMAVAGPVQASTGIDSTHVSTFLSKAGVPSKDVEAVVEKVENGEQLDFETNKKPESVKTERKGDWEVTTERYPDGSVEVTELEQPLNEVSPGTVSPQATPTNCKVKGGSGYRSYTNCHVRRTNPAYSMGFKASYTIVRKGKDYIGGVHGLETKCYAGTCSKSKLNTTRKKETASAKATAKASTVYKTYGGSSSRNVWLKLWVGKDKATITKN